VGKGGVCGVGVGVFCGWVVFLFFFLGWFFVAFFFFFFFLSSFLCSCLGFVFFCGLCFFFFVFLFFFSFFVSTMAVFCGCVAFHCVPCLRAQPFRPIVSVLYHCSRRMIFRPGQPSPFRVHAQSRSKMS